MNGAHAILIFGPPGSGKSTQAALLADTLAYEVVDTGRILRGVLYDPSRQDDPEIKAERERFDSGVLVTPSFVIKTINEHILELGKRGVACVLGGSPRTMQEAESLLPELITAYGKEYVQAILLDVPQEICAARNLVRATCTICGRPQLATGPAAAAPMKCRACGGALYTRADASAITTRFQEYTERTVPIFAYIESQGVPVYRIDGAQAPGAVYGELVDYLDRA